MAVIPGTDSYGSNAEADAYWDLRNNLDWASLPAGDKDVHLINATDWLERTFRSQWRGVRETEAQRLAWSRLQAFDDDGFALLGTPEILKEAQFIVAEQYRAGTLDMEGFVSDSDSAVIKEKVDVIEVEYDSGSRILGADVLTPVFQMLRSITTGSALLRT